jgi:aspartyl-tRNA(Asn)/glutamyl-tRNA(Gln) amidotransferase subunit A
MFGHRSENATDLESTFKKSRAEGFGPEVQRRIMTGTFVLSSDHYDAYYTKAQKVRRVIQDKTFAILKDYDFILLPTTPGPAFDLGAKASDPIAMYLADIFTVQAPLAGIPAISVPGAIHSSGLPFGIQIMADYFNEGKMMAFGKKVHEMMLKKA